jgi:hypothetical protein
MTLDAPNPQPRYDMMRSPQLGIEPLTATLTLEQLQAEVERLEAEAA